MNIALFGTGRMGQAIAALAPQLGHQVILQVNRANRPYIRLKDLAPADIVIDFTHADIVEDNIRLAWQAGKPVLTGTTGWTDRLPAIAEECQQKGHTLLYGSNFAPGVNLLFAITGLVKRFVEAFPDYRVRLQEVHHVHKKDAPSGTAITLAQKLLGTRYQNWKLVSDHEEASAQVVPITARREGDVKGIHELTIAHPMEELRLRHEARDRKIFALGALRAAEWLLNKTGFFTVEDFYRELLYQ